MMLKRRLFRTTLPGLLILSLFLVSQAPAIHGHHHESPVDEATCPICFAASQVSAAIPPVPADLPCLVPARCNPDLPALPVPESREPRDRTSRSPPSS